MGNRRTHWQRNRHVDADRAYLDTQTVLARSIAVASKNGDAVIVFMGIDQIDRDAEIGHAPNR